MEQTIELGGSSFRVSYNFEAIEGIQSDLGSDSLNDLYSSLRRVVNEMNGDSKDVATIMRAAKIVIFHGIRGAALEDDQPIPFKSPAHVGARIKSMEDAGKHLGLFSIALGHLFNIPDGTAAGNESGRTEPANQ